MTVDLSVNTLSTGIGNPFGWGSGSATYEVPPPPVQTDYPALEDYSRCALGCFAATYAQSTVPYFSLGAPRNVTLVYNGDRLDPKPFVHVDFTVSGSVPSYLQLRVRKADGTYVTFLNGESALRFQAAAGTWRLGGQFDAASNGMGATGAYLVDVIVGQMLGSLQETVVATRRLLVVNENNSPIARGWTLAGIQRLYPISGGGALVTESDGSATYFGWDGTQFMTPAGDFSRLTGTGGWVRAYPDSTRVTFNSSGQMVSVTDAWSNTTTIQYDGSGRVYRITDPQGIYQELAYGSYGLSTVTALSRTTQVSVASNRTLTWIKDPDNVATNFGYDGSLRLASITDRRGTTVAELAYHSPSGKVASVTGPYIPVYQNGMIRPVDSLTAWQLAGVPYGPTGTPVPPVRSDTARARVRDPGNHVTRFTVDALGQVRDVVDPVGNAASVLYTPFFQVDSIIDPLGVAAGFDYDQSGNLARATLGGITTRLRYTHWAQVDSVWGDVTPVQQISVGANGRINWVRVAGQPNVTTYSYDTRGRVVQETDAEGHLVAKTWYAGVNGNRSRDSLPGGRTTTYGYDSFGRLITIDQPGQPTRTIAYDTLNRVIRVYDGVNASPAVYAHDNLFLTSVTDPRSQVYGVAYNALGWPIRRTDPVGRSDSLEYNIDGLPARTVNAGTRRTPPRTTPCIVRPGAAGA